MGMTLLLAVLDRARQQGGDVESGWSWWHDRERAGLRLTDDDRRALDAQRQGRASHALTIDGDAQPLTGLAPVPQAIGIPAGTRNLDAAQTVLDWLVSSAASSARGLSAWQASTNGLQALVEAAPSLDVDWATRHYVAARNRWAAEFSAAAFQQ
jgi:hypothetical protein